MILYFSDGIGNQRAIQRNAGKKNNGKVEDSEKSSTLIESEGQENTEVKCRSTTTNLKDIQSSSCRGEQKL